MDSKYKRLLKDTGIFAIGNLGSKIILFLLVPLYTNFMSTEEYGTSDLVFTIAQLIIPFTSLVVFDAVQRFGLSKYENPDNVLLGGMVVCVAGSIVALAINPILGLYSAISEWRWYLIVYVLLNMFGSIEMVYLKARDKNKLFALFSMLQTLVLAMCNISFLCLLGMGISGYLLSACIASLVSVICPLVFGGEFNTLRRAKIDSDLLKRMCLFSAPLILNNVSWWGINSADKVIVDVILGGAALGIFTVATKIPSLINTIVNVFSQAWVISAVKEIESTKDVNYYSNVFCVYQFVAFGASILLVAVIKPFMRIYVGADFGDSWQYVPLLLVGASFSAIGIYYGQIFCALMKSMDNMSTAVVSAVVNVFLGIALVPTIGVWGAVISVYISYVVYAVQRQFIVLRYMPIDYGGWRYCANCIIATLQAILISLNIVPVISSIAAIVSFSAVNWSQIKALFSQIKALFSKIRSLFLRR